MSPIFHFVADVHMTPLESRIASIIQLSELTYGEIARRTGAESSAVSKWTKTGRISIAYFAKLCTVLDVDPSLLLYGEHLTEDEVVVLDELMPLQRKVIKQVRKLSKTDYFKLEEISKSLR